MAQAGHKRVAIWNKGSAPLAQLTVHYRQKHVLQARRSRPPRTRPGPLCWRRTPCADPPVPDLVLPRSLLLMCVASLLQALGLLASRQSRAADEAISHLLVKARETIGCEWRELLPQVIRRPLVV